MINERSLLAIQKNSTEGMCRPLYESYCFSRIPQTIKHLLTGKEGERLPEETTEGSSYDLVILIFVDGFGWRFFEKYKERFPFLMRFVNQGIVSKLTSQFPSTTAAHVTCINTDLLVGESGVYEWFYYEPLVDRMIAPLLFSFAGDHNPGTLKESGVATENFYPKHTFYENLSKEGITSYVMQNASIAHSPYSSAMFKGAIQVPFTSTKEALSNLADLSCKNDGTKKYIYSYFGEIDAAGHRHGIDSSQFETTVALFWQQVEEFFWKQLQCKDKKVACLVTADHGMVPVDPASTFYLNKEFPDIERYLKKNRDGDPLAPAGSCRDFFLHIQEERLHEVKDILTALLKDKARIVLTEDLIQQGFFGTKNPTETFLNRVGNLVILPHEGEGVWWYKKHHFEQHFYGAHGGLTRHEMEIPFLFLAL
ncbi:MAG: alkaline phosphatase family protein [Chlamydiota bacterium]